MTEDVKPTKSAADWYAQYQVARDLYFRGRERYSGWKRRREDATKYFVSIDEEDELFLEVQRWLVRDTDFNEQRSIRAFTRTWYDDEAETHCADLDLLSDEEYEAEVQIDGFTIDVEITSDALKKQPKKNDRDDPLAALTQSMGMTYNSFAGRRAVFTARSMEERDAVLGKLKAMVELTNKRERKSSFHIMSSTGYWTRSSSMSRRPLDTVVLASDNKERLVADFEKFLGEEKRYLELGLPWHHGYLLEGPPGTGKTSLISAVAHHFDMDVYYIPMTTVESDSVLQRSIANLESKRAVLVFEDIDIVSAARDRDNERKGVTLQGLLQALDGIATPHGLVTVMTTNDVSALADALVRPGRIDFTLHVGYVNDDQITRLCQRFAGRTFDLPHVAGEVTPAEIVGIFKSEDEEKVEEQLRALILEKNIKFQSEEGVQTESTEV